jgi:hypothetical protein
MMSGSMIQAMLEQLMHHPTINSGHPESSFTRMHRVKAGRVSEKKTFFVYLVKAEG